MVVPFNGVITISRDVAAQMNHCVSEYCKALRDFKEMQYRYRYETPTPQESLFMAKRANDCNSAALHLVELVLKNVIDPNFD